MHYNVRAVPYWLSLHAAAGSHLLGPQSMNAQLLQCKRNHHNFSSRLVSFGMSDAHTLAAISGSAQAIVTPLLSVLLSFLVPALTL